MFYGRVPNYFNFVSHRSYLTYVRVWKRGNKDAQAGMKRQNDKPHTDTCAAATSARDTSNRGPEHVLMVLTALLVLDGRHVAEEGDTRRPARNCTPITARARIN